MFVIALGLRLAVCRLTCAASVAGGWAWVITRLRVTGTVASHFGVEIADADLALLHQRSEGWAAALQMAALSLRGTTDPARAARALDIRSHAIAEYFIAEVLEQQPPEVARFMLDTSVLGELTADACTAVTGRQDAAALLRSIDATSRAIQEPGDAECLIP
jgi:LuxR family transcriptional regulator, maltose regulon positive regulatory protein